MRKAHHLEHQTIIIQKELASFDPSALEQIHKVFASYNQSQDRFDPNHPPHTSPDYDYLMYCKSFFVCDAIKRDLTDEEVLWFDFGYGLGSLTYIDPNQFNFMLSPCEKIKKNKINFFSLGIPDERTLPHILIYGTHHFLTGGCIYGNQEMWQKFNAHMQEALQAFISFNIIDDDQKLYIWCLRNYPDDFHLVWEDYWFHGLFYFTPPPQESYQDDKAHNPAFFACQRGFYTPPPLSSPYANTNQTFAKCKAFLKRLFNRLKNF